MDLRNESTTKRNRKSKRAKSSRRGMKIRVSVFKSKPQALMPSVVAIKRSRSFMKSKSASGKFAEKKSNSAKKRSSSFPKKLMKRSRSSIKRSKGSMKSSRSSMKSKSSSKLARDARGREGLLR